jgi:hypothetical protein
MKKTLLILSLMLPYVTLAFSTDAPTRPELSHPTGDSPQRRSAPGSAGDSSNRSVRTDNSAAPRSMGASPHSPAKLAPDRPGASTARGGVLRGPGNTEAVRSVINATARGHVARQPAMHPVRASPSSSAVAGAPSSLVPGGVKPPGRGAIVANRLAMNTQVTSRNNMSAVHASPARLATIGGPVVSRMVGAGAISGTTTRRNH